MSTIFGAIGSYLKGLGLILLPKNLKYLVLSGLASILFYAIAFGGAWYGGDYLTDLLTDRIANDKWRGIVDSIANVLSFLGLGLILLILYKHVVLVVTSPLMGPLSESIEVTQLKGTPQHPNKFGAGYSLWRGLRIALRNIVKELGLTLVLFILGMIIPPLAFLTTPLIVVLQAYYAGFANMDYFLERHLNYSESVSYVKSNRLAAIANGGLFLALLFIPVLGAFLAPSLGASAASIQLTKKFY